MKAYIFRDDVGFCGIDLAGNICCKTLHLQAAIDEAGCFSAFFHRQKVSVELVSGDNKKFDKAFALCEKNPKREAMLVQLRDAEGRGELEAIIREVAR